MKRFLPYPNGVKVGAILCYLLCFAPVLLFAQIRGSISSDHFLIQTATWTEATGLPNWRVRDIIEDERGGLWLATDNGLTFFDGTKFTNFIPQISGIKWSDLQRITEDSRQNIWMFFGTPGSSLKIFIYDPFANSFQSIEDYLGRPLSFNNEALKCIGKMNGAIWIFDPKTGYGGRFNEKGVWEDAFQDLHHNKQKKLYFASPDGNFWSFEWSKLMVQLLDNVGNPLRQFHFKDILNNRICQATNGDIYAMENVRAPNTPFKILKLDLHNGFETLEEVPPFLNRWGEVLNGASAELPMQIKNQEGFSLLIDSRTTQLFQNKSIIPIDIHAYFKNQLHLDICSGQFVKRDGSFWVTTNSALIRIEIKPKLFTSYLQEMSLPQSMRGIATLDGIIYANSYSGYYKIDTKTKKTEKLKIFTPSYGLAMARIEDEVWIAHDGYYVSVWNPKTMKLKKVPIKDGACNAGFCFGFPKDGSVLMGTTDGVFKKAKGANGFKHFALPSVNISFIHENKRGIWIGSANGLTLLDSTGRIIGNYLESLTAQHTTPSIYFVHEDSAGFFWLATDNGLWCWNPETGQHKIFNSNTSQFPSDKIHAVYEDHRERLWLTSNNGLILFDKKSQNVYSFFTADGLPFNEFNNYSYYDDHNGRLFFGGISGLVSFYPDSIVLNRETHKVTLTSLEIKDVGQKWARNLTRGLLFGNEKVTITPELERISITFTALDYNGDRLKYRWRFQTKDSIWNYIDQPQILLYNLPYGNYNMEIQVIDEGNVLAKSNSLLIPFEVPAPIYLKPWFILSLLYLGLMIIFLLGLARQRHLIAAKVSLETRINQKTEQLRKERDVISHQASLLKQLNAQKTRFFQDVTHEIRTPLTLIIGPVSDMLKHGHLQEEHKLRLERVKRNAQKLLFLTEEIMEISKLEAGVVVLNKGAVEIATLIQQSFSTFRPMAKEKNIQYVLQNDLPQKWMVPLDFRKVEKIINNLISNALKYTHEGGSVTLVASTDLGKCLKVKVKDNGIGISPEHLPHIFERFYIVPREESNGVTGGFGIGLAMSKQYAELMHGRLEVESHPGQGTVMTLYIPLINGEEGENAPPQ